ncbi:hypothetical protein AB0L88_16225 [Saccharopolyspora shandongensis]|uniref:hypothetical protein n=1 Tax=Saccharopolyspora shandongensis TaxID=418495 RepID=UPI0034295C0C
MTPVLAVVQTPSNVLGFLGVVVAVSVVAALLPLRGGHGQHANAGPGSVMVWQLIDVIAAETRHPEPPARQPPEPIDWPTEEYIGRHRLVSDRTRSSNASSHGR